MHADLSLCWAHMSEGTFSQVVAVCDQYVEFPESVPFKIQMLIPNCSYFVWIDVKQKAVCNKHSLSLYNRNHYMDNSLSKTREIQVNPSPKICDDN